MHLTYAQHSNTPLRGGELATRRRRTNKQQKTCTNAQHSNTPLKGGELATHKRRTNKQQQTCTNTSLQRGSAQSKVSAILCKDLHALFEVTSTRAAPAGVFNGQNSKQVAWFPTQTHLPKGIIHGVGGSGGSQ